MLLLSLTLFIITNLETGDFIFVDLDCGEICDAIESVTQEQFNTRSYSFSHVALIERESNTIYTIDAWPGVGVRRIKLREFLDSMEIPKAEISKRVIHGKISPPFRKKAKHVVTQAKSFIGTHYDEIFQMGPQSLYCSELILFSWPEVFKTEPMFYGKQGSAERNVWSNYFKKINQKIPDEEPGLSPLGIYIQAKRASVISKLVPLQLSQGLQ